MKRKILIFSLCIIILLPTFLIVGSCATAGTVGFVYKPSDFLTYAGGHNAVHYGNPNNAGSYDFYEPAIYTDVMPYASETRLHCQFKPNFNTFGIEISPKYVYELSIPFSFERYYQQHPTIGNQVIQRDFAIVSDVQIALVFKGQSDISYTFVPSVTNFSTHTVYMFTLEMSGQQLNELQYIVLYFTAQSNPNRNNASVYPAVGGLYKYQSGNILDNAYKLEITGEYDPNNDPLYGVKFGDGYSKYFDLEAEINGNVDNSAYFKLMNDLSIFDNFGTGIAVVRELMNEFINYNGFRWTWVYNLLMISLFLGVISFLFGTTNIFSSFKSSKSKKQNDDYKRNSIGFNADIGGKKK